MDTKFDWVTVIIFAGLVTHFLQQSASHHPRPAPLWQYAVAAAGCALANWLGNSGQVAAGCGIIALTLCFIAYLYFRRSGAHEDH